MTVYELKQILRDFDDDCDVRLAMQPNWPFELSIGDVIGIGDTVYIAEDKQIGYLNEEASNELGWK